MSELDGALVAALLVAGALALRALPWTDAEISAVHRAALGLLRRAWTPSRRHRQGATHTRLGTQQDL